MELKDIINRIEDFSVVALADFIFQNNYSFDDFSLAVINQGGWDSAEKRRKILALIKQKDDELYTTSNSVETLEFYLSRNWCVLHKKEAQAKIDSLINTVREQERQRQEYEWKLNEIEDNINDYDIDDIKDISDKVLSDILKNRGYEGRGVDLKKIRNYIEPFLRYNDIPQNENEIPLGYTDVFFWGIPSSGKTCALATIFSTIKKDYTMGTPDCDKKFGATYRDSLINIFLTECGYLPGRTSIDKTQYMPFLFSDKKEKKARKISFFEVSGEVFRYFYEVSNNTKIIPESEREDIEKSFRTLDLLLKSNNQKIHFFFIDYNQETKNSVDKYQLTQSNYLEAAATYFRDVKDKNGRPIDIFKKKTDSVYVVVSKSDEIKGDNPLVVAKSFLDENFGSFMRELKKQCENHSVDFKVKLFSIGDVIFKKICIINRAYSHDIIRTLLDRVRPINGSVWGKFLNS